MNQGTYRPTRRNRKEDKPHQGRMTMKEISLAALILFVLIFALMSNAQAQSPQQTLNQYISDLQKNPGDNALREKIIKHVQTMTPSPAIPEEARRHYVMAVTLSKDSKKIEDYNASIDEFKSALLIAPWWPDANRELGIAAKNAQRYDEAIAALKLYIATNPGRDKARATQDEIYRIEAKKKELQQKKGQ
jgi:tetratricopeptide (TPR) repeat protein